MADGGVIGVFDSGVGGISVLRHLTAELPAERFAYFGDSANAPYGTHTPAEIAALSRSIVGNLVRNGAKAVVIACNTATAVAASELRAAYPDLPIVGVEPALKPALTATPGGRVLVMATPVTLALEKYQRLAARLGGTDRVIPVACDGLAARIEQGNLGGADLHALVEQLVGEHRGAVDGVVLGCTHYPFVADVIRDVLGDVALYDGGAGTARQLRRRLTDAGLLAPGDASGGVTFASSKDTPEELALYRWFYELPATAST